MKDSLDNFFLQCLVQNPKSGVLLWWKSLMWLPMMYRLQTWNRAPWKLYHVVTHYFDEKTKHFFSILGMGNSSHWKSKQDCPNHHWTNRQKRLLIRPRWKSYEISCSQHGPQFDFGHGNDNLPRPFVTKYQEPLEAFHGNFRSQSHPTGKLFIFSKMIIINFFFIM